MLALLLVTAERPDALRTALAARPDAILLDLGAAARDGRAAARRRVAAMIAEAKGEVGRPRLVVRTAPLETDLVDEDLAAVLGEAPDAILTPGLVGIHDLERLGAKLAAAEAVLGLEAASTGIVAGAGDTARGILALPSLVGGGPRLRAFAFDGAVFGAPETAPAMAARGALVLAARAAGVPALDLGMPAQGDAARAASLARRDGFSGRLARSPGEVAAIRGAKDD